MEIRIFLPFCKASWTVEKGIWFAGHDALVVGKHIRNTLVELRLQSTKFVDVVDELFGPLGYKPRILELLRVFCAFVVVARIRVGRPQGLLCWHDVARIAKLGSFGCLRGLAKGVQDRILISMRIFALF